MLIENLETLAELIDDRYKVADHQKHLLVEKNQTTEFVKFESRAKIIVYDDKVEYLTCRFEDKSNNPSKPELFPYFGRVEKLRKNCDYIIFVKREEEFYILLIELKLYNTSNKPQEQLYISGTFVDFLLRRFAVAGYTFVTPPKIRFIGIRDTQLHTIRPKQYTKPRDCVYDHNYIEIRDNGGKRHIPIRLNALLK